MCCLRQLVRGMLSNVGLRREQRENEMDHELHRPCGTDRRCVGCCSETQCRNVGDAEQPPQAGGEPCKPGRASCCVLDDWRSGLPVRPCAALSLLNSILGLAASHSCCAHVAKGLVPVTCCALAACLCACSLPTHRACFTAAGVPATLGLSVRVLLYQTPKTPFHRCTNTGDTRAEV